MEYFTLRGQWYTSRIGVGLHKNSGVAWSTSYQWCGLHQYFTPREPLVHVYTKENGGVAYTRVWLGVLITLPLDISRGTIIGVTDT